MKWAMRGRRNSISSAGSSVSPALSAIDRHHFVLGDLAFDHDGGRLAHGGMSENLGFHLERGDVLAAPADRVLQPIDKIEVAFGVAPEAVAGVEPAIAPGRRGRLGIAGVAMRHRPGAVRAHDRARRPRRPPARNRSRRRCAPRRRGAAGRRCRAPSDWPPRRSAARSRSC